MLKKFKMSSLADKQNAKAEADIKSVKVKKVEKPKKTKLKVKRKK